MSERRVPVEAFIEFTVDDLRCRYIVTKEGASGLLYLDADGKWQPHAIALADPDAFKAFGQALGAAFAEAKTGVDRARGVEAVFTVSEDLAEAEFGVSCKAQDILIKADAKAQMDIDPSLRDYVEGVCELIAKTFYPESSMDILVHEGELVIGLWASKDPEQLTKFNAMLAGLSAYKGVSIRLLVPE